MAGTYLRIGLCTWCEAHTPTKEKQVFRQEKSAHQEGRGASLPQYVPLLQDRIHLTELKGGWSRGAKDKSNTGKRGKTHIQKEKKGYRMFKEHLRRPSGD